MIATLRFLGVVLQTLPRRPLLAWAGLRWWLLGKRQRARNLLASEVPLDRAPARKADRFLAAAPLSAIAPLASVIDLTRPIAVYVWADGNFFFTDIAVYTVAFLQRLGADARLCAEATPPPADHELVIVAPHEFVIHGPGRGWPAAALDRAIPLNTEQWHTSWFALARPLLVRAKRGLDINPASAAGLARLGVRCGFLPLLPLPGTPFAHPDAPLSPALAAARHIPGLSHRAAVAERAPPAGRPAFAERPIAVAYLGVANLRRDRALASLAPVLARHRCLIHAPRFAGPVRPGDPDMIGAGDVAQIARHAQILLNIHQGESRYFEWHRIVVSGIMEGCVVLSEPSLATGLVHPGRHIIECPLAEMPGRLAHLLETEAGRAELAAVHRAAMSLRALLLAAAETRDGLLGLCQPGV